MIKNSNIICLGGAGTLGYAIARRRRKDGWAGTLTVYSTDTHKHEMMRKEFPDLNFVQGDIRNPQTLYNAMVGHDVVIHAAAVKVIPASEVCSVDTIDVNVTGSTNVCACAIQANVKHVLGISTDKACHPANAYGASKYLMEKIFAEYARAGLTTQFHLVRYGNVLESNGSVIEAWKNAIARGEKIKITDPNMTRFWLSPSQAVDCIIESLELPSGWIYIPKMPSLHIDRLMEYTIGRVDFARVPLRPGEKIHEELLTVEEGSFATDAGTWYMLAPTTSPRVSDPVPPFNSEIARRLTKDELIALLEDE